MQSLSYHTCLGLQSVRAGVAQLKQEQPFLAVVKFYSYVTDSIPRIYHCLSHVCQICVILRFSSVMNESVVSYPVRILSCLVSTLVKLLLVESNGQG